MRPPFAARRFECLFFGAEIDCPAVVIVADSVPEAAGAVLPVPHFLTVLV